MSLTDKLDLFTHTSMDDVEPVAAAAAAAAAPYVVYSVNMDDLMEDGDEEHEVPDYDNDNDGLRHLYGTVSGTPSCKQYFTAMHEPVGPVVYRYKQQGTTPLRAFMYRKGNK